METSVNQPSTTPRPSPAPQYGAPQEEFQRRPYRRDMIELQHERGQFERESLETSLEGRIALMAALAARIREVCAGLQGHPRVRDMAGDDKISLREAVEDAGNLAMSLSGFMQALLEQAPTRAARERGLRDRNEPPRAHRPYDGPTYHHYEPRDGKQHVGGR